MHTSNTLLRKLLEKKILTTNKNISEHCYQLIWNGEVIATSINYALPTHVYNFKTTSIGEEYIQHEPSASVYSWAKMHELLDFIYYTTYKKNLFFKNGQIKQSTIKDLQERCAQSSTRNWISTRLITQEITKKWDKILDKSKNQISHIFNTDGVCIMYFKIINLLEENGEISEERIDSTTVRLIHELLRPDYAIYVLNTLPKDHTITHNSISYGVTKFEYDYYYILYGTCKKCGTVHQKENFVFGICPNCAGRYPKALAGYSDRATTVFDFAVANKSKYSSRYLGVELEYEYETKLNEVLFLLYQNLKTHAIFKRDGSLDQGVEICTRPAPINIHIAEFKKMFDDADCMQRLIVKPTCGMHVHVDRQKMTALTLGKLINFIQSKNNAGFLEIIAERRSNRFAALSTDLSVTSYHRGVASAERYQGINTQNKTTAELRIFRTPNTFNSFLKNMEFVTALSDFVQPANSGIKELDYGNFIKYVHNNCSTYKELNKFIKEKCE